MQPCPKKSARNQIALGSVLLSSTEQLIDFFSARQQWLIGLDRSDRVGLSSCWAQALRSNDLFLMRSLNRSATADEVELKHSKIR